MQDLEEDRQRIDDDTLATREIALGNLRSAVGLPGPAVDEREIPAYLDKVNAWAALVRTGTERMLPKFRQNPDQYEGTLGKFQMLVLVTVLQRNLGVTYHRRFSEGEYDGSDPRNLFLHGVLTGFGGTCVTMPLLYIAIGRRLGYPLFLVETKEHLFVRWEGAGERFNIEATSPGFVSRDTDDYYREWPRRITDDEVARGEYLRNLTPEEELGYSRLSRGICFFEHLILDEAIEAFDHAGRLAPRSRTIQGSLAVARAARVLLQDLGRRPDASGPRELRERAGAIISEAPDAAALRRAERDIFRIMRNRQSATMESADQIASLRPQESCADSTGSLNSTSQRERSLP